ncbi:MAG: hypothetical protein HYX68_08130 [Planctomycetes bacterium]|nr:hypothetical protein [Planctomycetota bacterium]
MYRLLVAAALVGLVPGLSHAVEIKNVRPCFGPLGATRINTTCLPGDVLFMTYDIEDLKIDAKTGKAKYDTTLELLDEKGKVIFEKKTPNDVLPQLGGTRMPGDLHVIMPPKQPAGKYSVRLTVHDKLADNAKRFSFPFEVESAGFGCVGVAAPGIALPGQHHVTGFALVNLAVNAKKDPDVEVSYRILENGKAVASTVKIFLPQQMPAGVNLAEANFVPLNFPVYLNRPGQYTVEVSATDKIAKKTREFRYKLTVLDVSSLVGR